MKNFIILLRLNLAVNLNANTDPNDFETLKRPPFSFPVDLIEVSSEGTTSSSNDKISMQSGILFTVHHIFSNLTYI